MSSLTSEINATVIKVTGVRGGKRKLSSNQPTGWNDKREREEEEEEVLFVLLNETPSVVIELDLKSEVVFKEAVGDKDHLSRYWLEIWFIEKHVTIILIGKKNRNLPRVKEGFMHHLFLDLLEGWP